VLLDSVSADNRASDPDRDRGTPTRSSTGGRLLGRRSLGVYDHFDFLAAAADSFAGTVTAALPVDGGAAAGGAGGRVGGRLSADLADHLAADRNPSRSSCLATRAEVDAVAARYNLVVRRYLTNGAVLKVTAGQLAAMREDASIDHLSGDVRIQSAGRFRGAECRRGSAVGRTGPDPVADRRRSRAWR